MPTENKFIRVLPASQTISLKEYPAGTVFELQVLDPKPKKDNEKT